MVTGRVEPEGPEELADLAPTVLPRAAAATLGAESLQDLLGEEGLGPLVADGEDGEERRLVDVEDGEGAGSRRVRLGPDLRERR